MDHGAGGPYVVKDIFGFVPKKIEIINTCMVYYVRIILLVLSTEKEFLQWEICVIGLVRVIQQ